MDRERVLGETLRLVASQDARLAVAMLQTWYDDTADPFAGPLSAFAAFMAGDHDDALSRGLRAAEQSGVDPVTRACAGAVLGWVAATTDEADAGEPFAGLGDLVGAIDTDDRCGSFVGYLAVEGALAAARLDLAQDLHPGGRPAYAIWEGHPYAPVMLACDVRLAVFRGRIDEAQAMLSPVESSGAPGDLLKATAALVAGNAADIETMRALIAEVAASDVDPRDHLGRGVHLLLAFAVVALSDRAGAARHLLRAGGNADLSGLTVIDRVLGYELLTAAALDEDDLDAARSWVALADEWSGHRAAAPAVARMHSRVALLAGAPAEAVEHATRAIALARDEGRAVEAAEGEIVLARARIAADAVPDATRALRDAVASSDRNGHHAMRQSASRTLRAAGRRLPPVTGGGRDSLSPRERDVADLILSGVDNDAIAERLHLSPATVRTHCSRILTAYGVATRIGLLAAVNPRPDVPLQPADLTPQQARVVDLVARALTNQQIADELDISVKGVEKHVRDVLIRWDVPTRFSIARHWWQLQR